MIRICAFVLLFVATDITPATEFRSPTRLRVGNEFVRVESPGYACPAWTDIDGDGKKDLLVGQFNGGKILVCQNLGQGKLAKGKWLRVGDKAAEVPGVW